MIHGIINVLKPTGMSSHDVIGCLRRIYGMKKMGHAGTLDPLAAGVLPVYAGQATRLIEYGDSDVKIIPCRIRLRVGDGYGRQYGNRRRNGGRP